VPLAAVFTEKNAETGEMERFVYVQDGDNFEKRIVKVGVSDFTSAEIQEGLKPGEVVSLELPKEEREKKARQIAIQKKSGGDAVSPGQKPATASSGTVTNRSGASSGGRSAAETAPGAGSSIIKVSSAGAAAR